MVMSDDAVSGLRKLVDAVHATGTKVSVQLGHAGPVAAATGERFRSANSGRPAVISSRFVRGSFCRINGTRRS